MLNRRTLRIKIMQQLFALLQGREANYQVAKFKLKERFSPNLNSMEVQDPEMLTAKRSEAVKMLSDMWLFSQRPSRGADEEVVEAVEEEIRNIREQNDRDRAVARETMVKDIEQLQCGYLSFIELILEFHSLAESDKRFSHDNFVNNLLISSLRLNKQIQDAILECGKRWDGHSEARSWFRNLISENEKYREYLQLDEPGFEDDRSILSHLFKKVVFKSEVIDKYLEDRDLFWAENKPIIRSLILKTIKAAEKDDEVRLQDISYNFEDDKTFFVRLFDETNELNEEYRRLISEKAKNWEVDRLAATDRIILEMAMAEMIFFPSIPVKVTINEYIEISKIYSTPKSKKFINGMLDVIAEELTASGAIRKSGRGLMDNK